MRNEDCLVRSHNSVEYFKDLVERAMQRQGFASSDLSSFYLVQLLDAFVDAEQIYASAEVEKDQPLAELLCHALRSEGNRRFTLLKLTGDVALFISGFFSDSIARRRMELDYYVRMGGYAYGRAAGEGPQEVAAVFQELSTKFGRFVDVLNEISEESQLTDSASILRLYERWLTTRSERSAALLRHQGVLLGHQPSQVH